MVHARVGGVKAEEMALFEVYNLEQSLLRQSGTCQIQLRL